MPDDLQYGYYETGYLQLSMFPHFSIYGPTISEMINLTIQVLLFFISDMTSFSTFYMWNA